MLFVPETARCRNLEKILNARDKLCRLSETHTVTELLQDFLDEAEKLTDSRIAFLCWLAEDQEHIVSQVWSANTLRNRCKMDRTITHADISQAGTWADCVRTKQPVFHNTLLPRNGTTKLPEGHPPVLRELVVPIIRKDKVVAVLGVGNKPDNYHQEDCQLLSGFADVFWDSILRKQAEEKMRIAEQSRDEALKLAGIRKSEADLNVFKYQMLLEEAHFGYALADAQTGILLECNQALSRMLERGKDELIGQPQAIMHAGPVFKNGLSFTFLKHRDEQPGAVLEDRFLTKSGHVLDVEIHAQKFTLNSREVMFAIIRDISKRKLADIQLRESEQKYRMISENLNDVVWTFDLTSQRFTYFSPSVRFHRGYTPEEAMQLTLEESLTPDSYLKAKQRISELAQRPFDPDEDIRALGHIELDEIHKDGSVLTTEIMARFLRNEKNQPTGIVGISRDITERKKNEHALRQEKDKFSKLFEQVTDYALILKYEEEELIIVDLNESACKYHGYRREELQGQSIQLIDKRAQAIPRVKETLAELAQGKTIKYEGFHQCKDGRTFPFEASIRMVEFDGQQLLFSIERDLTEQKQKEQERRDLEHQLRQKYKMEAIGLMAGGIAHNFNNNLSIILGNLELTRARLSPTSGLLEYIENAATGVTRSRDLVRQILTYSRKDKQEQAVIQPGLIIEETLKLLRSTLPTSVGLNYHSQAEKNTITILADSTRLQEALINLCANSVHSMNEKGELNISLERIELTDQTIPPRWNCRPGTYACIKVQDSGSGISEDIFEKIFDPFFTTKRMSQGTGMGLATVHGIVEQHGGMITVDSAPGRETTFNLYFPINENTGNKQREPMESQQRLQGSQEHILLIDDDEMLAQVHTAMLKDSGYRVTLKTDSLEALELIRNNPDQIDLVITDQTMPSLTGSELAGHIQSEHPELPVVLLTGFSNQISAEQAEKHGIAAFCMKPIEMSQLLSTIREVLKNH